MRALSLILVAAVLIGASTRFAQSQGSLRVVFVEATDLQMASITNNGADGLTRLVSIFSQLGARITLTHLDQPIPDDANLVVLVGPRSTISPEELTRLWIHLEKGNSLLLALDPPGQTGNPDVQGGGTDRLLSFEYGIGLLNGLLVDSASTLETVRDPKSSVALAYPDAIANAITAPLTTYGLPMYMWGARNLQTEVLAQDSSATPLLDSFPEYAETDRQVFQDPSPVPLTLNIGVDYQGTMVVGALSENRTNQSRIAVIGDGDMFRNGLGLAPDPGSQTPAYAGDYIFTQRLASWLLRLPETDWPGLPRGMTWIVMDGAGDDWPAQAASTADAKQDVSILPLDIQGVRAFRNSDYLYLLVETAVAANPNSQVSIDIDANVDRKIDGTITIDAQGARFTSADGVVTPLPDAALVVGQGIEIRLPLRMTGIVSRLPKVCLTMTQLAFVPEPDCVEAVAVPQVAQQDPASLRLTDGIIGTITRVAVNLRATPSTSGKVVTAVGNGDTFLAIGRNTAGDWILVENARYTGWIASALISLSGDALTLPVIAPAG